MTNVVLFGMGKVAEVVHYHLTNDSDVRVAAFTCEPEFLDRSEFLGLPVVPFDDIENTFPPGSFEMFVALGYQDMNELRTARLSACRRKGYRTPTFIHPNADIARDVILGDHCFVMGQVSLQPRVVIGDNVFIWGGAVVGHHSRIGDNCWITSNVGVAGVTRIGRNCFLGMNATVVNDVSVGEGCFIGANALVTSDLEDNRVVVQAASEVLRVTPEQFLRISPFH